MADVKSLTVDGTKYNIKDATARTDISTLTSSVNSLDERVDDVEDAVDALETASANHVTLDTEQSITGQKTFSVADDLPILLKTRDNITSAPASTVATTIGLIDNNGNWVGGWEHYHEPNGDVYKKMVVRKQNGDAYALIQVGIRSNGRVYTAAPTPAASSMMII